MQEQDELDLSDIDSLDPQIVELIQEKARAKACLNRKHANGALHTYDGLFRQIYGSLAKLVNVREIYSILAPREEPAKV